MRRMRFTGETVPAGVRGCARARSHVGEDPTVAPAILPARRPYEVDDYTRIPLQRGGNAWVYVFAPDEGSRPST